MAGARHAKSPPTMDPATETVTLVPQQDTTLSQLLDVCTTVLQQGVDLLDAHITSNDQLTVHSQFLPGSTIGKHLRHSRDHFELLLDCMKSGSPPYVLSYDTRLRNTPMEVDRHAAREALQGTIEKLQTVVPGIDEAAQIKLQAVTPYLHEFGTTFGRELWFAALHTVHHFSMIRVIASELNIQLAEDFGWAPSTLVYHSQTSAPLGKAKI
uniref:DinB-like domain-containing protein n=1 Tax=Mycena chlorophos TaxID=658473 RepID=A0ABQ0LF40_MYCCL|nr:predicted protein [Mycena chlorophos]